MALQEINDGTGDAAFEHSELVIRLLDTPEVQRTEGVMTNGLCGKAYPGISHNRKTHLIGVAKHAALTFKALSKKGVVLDSSHQSVLEALAMTHDLGHPPFSHVLGRVVERVVGYSHEDISARIVLGDMTFFDYFSKRPHLLGKREYVADILRKYEKIPRIPDILRKYGVDALMVAAALSPSVAGKEIGGYNHFIRELIDGKMIDIDKMDYLPRDSRAANVPEAIVDPSRILNGLSIVDYNGMRRLAIADDALSVLNLWVASRKHMRSTVYTHKTVIKFESMLAEALKRSLPYFTENDIEVHWLTDSELMGLLKRYDKVSAELAFDVEYGRQFKFSEAYSIPSEGVDERSQNESYQDLMVLTDFMRQSRDRFPEDTVRDLIVTIANTYNGPAIRNHEVSIYFPDGFRTEEENFGRIDLLMFQKKHPEELYPLVDVAGGRAKVVNRTAENIGFQMCTPDFSTYFTVFCSKGNEERINLATKEFIKELRQGL